MSVSLVRNVKKNARRFMSACFFKVALMELSEHLCYVVFAVCLLYNMYDRIGFNQKGRL